MIWKNTEEVLTGLEFKSNLTERIDISQAGQIYHSAIYFYESIENDLNTPEEKEAVKSALKKDLLEYLDEIKKIIENFL